MEMNKSPPPYVEAEPPPYSNYQTQVAEPPQQMLVHVTAYPTAPQAVVQSRSNPSNIQGIIQINYMPAELCAECWACCACCWMLPQPQPESQKKYDIYHNGACLGTITQGQQQSYSLPSGRQMIELHEKKGAVIKFFSNLVGSSNSVASSAHVDIHPGGVAKYKIGYTVPKCKGNKHYVFFEPE